MGTILSIILRPEAGSKKAKTRSVVVEEIITETVEDDAPKTDETTSEAAADADTDADADKKDEDTTEDAAKEKDKAKPKSTILRLRVVDAPEPETTTDVADDDDDSDDSDYSEEEEEDSIEEEEDAELAGDVEGGADKDDDNEETKTPDSFNITVDIANFKVVELDGQESNFEYEQKDPVEEAKVDDSGPEQIVWMIKRRGKDNVWSQMPDSVNDNIEEAFNKFQGAKSRRGSSSGQVNEVHLYIKLGEDEKFAITFFKKRDKSGDDGSAMNDDGNTVAVRRFAITSTGINRQIALLSLNYNQVCSFVLCVFCVFCSFCVVKGILLSSLLQLTSFARAVANRFTLCVVEVAWRFCNECGMVEKR